MLFLDKWPKEGKVIKLNLVTLADTVVATAPSPKATLTKGVSDLCSLVLKIFNRSRLLRTMFNSDHSSTLTRYLVSLSQKKNVHFCALPHPPGDNLPCWLTNTVHIYIYQSRSIFIVCSWKKLTMVNKSEV